MNATNSSSSSSSNGSANGTTAVVDVPLDITPTPPLSAADAAAAAKQAKQAKKTAAAAAKQAREDAAAAAKKAADAAAVATLAKQQQKELDGVDAQKIEIMMQYAASQNIPKADKAYMAGTSLWFDFCADTVITLNAVQTAYPTLSHTAARTALQAQYSAFKAAPGEKTLKLPESYRKVGECVQIWELLRLLSASPGMPSAGSPRRYVPVDTKSWGDIDLTFLRNIKSVITEDDKGNWEFRGQAFEDEARRLVAERRTTEARPIAKIVEGLKDFNQQVIDDATALRREKMNADELAADIAKAEQQKVADQSADDARFLARLGKQLAGRAPLPWHPETARKKLLAAKLIAPEPPLPETIDQLAARLASNSDDASKVIVAMLGLIPSTPSALVALQAMRAQLERFHAATVSAVNKVAIDS